MPDSQSTHETQVSEAQTHEPQTSQASDELSPGPITLVTLSQLPLSCPLPEHELWNMHPRVFIDIETTGTASCPYCGAQYKLETSRQ